ncbi:YmfQ family protein [Fodinicurvata fenggangensis]|uniref:YmfQ family protein n=1 Tax=Fodinicurvata fenggangensis TaxID=1121830 RepID=UPI000557B018|nr:putative phage tail protein [Fodinicurvata fenggangensis]
MPLQDLDRDDYYRQLLQLRPPGPAWPAEDPLLEAIAEGLATVHARTADLMDEADPRATLEMLPAWERNAGLPDDCTGPAEGLVARRERLVQQLTEQAGQSRAFFIELAETLGYPDATITEFRPFNCQSDCDDSLDPDPWRHAWRLNLQQSENIHDFTATSGCDEALRVWGNEVLECIVRRLKPAHTNVLFAYGVSE